MANNGNLIRPTAEQARELGRRGGLASAKAKKEAKNRKLIASELLDATLNGGNVDKLKKQFGLSDEELTAYQVLILSCVKTAISKGDTAALEKLLKIAGETFTESLDLTVSKSEKLCDVIKQLQD